MQGTDLITLVKPTCPRQGHRLICNILLYLILSAISGALTHATANQQWTHEAPEELLLKGHPIAASLGLRTGLGSYANTSANSQPRACLCCIRCGDASLRTARANFIRSMRPPAGISVGVHPCSPNADLITLRNHFSPPDPSRLSVHLSILVDLIKFASWPMSHELDTGRCLILSDHLVGDPGTWPNADDWT